MLHGHEEGGVVRREIGGRTFPRRCRRRRTAWHAASRAFRLHAPDAVRASGPAGRIAVSGPPRGALAVHAQLSGLANQPSRDVALEKVAPTSAMAGSPHLMRMSQVSGAPHGRRPAGGDFHDMAEGILRARVGGVHLVFLAAVVGGEHHMTRPVFGFTSTSSGRSMGVAPRASEARGPRSAPAPDLRTRSPEQRSLTVDERAPLARSVRMEDRDGEGRPHQKVPVGGRNWRGPWDGR